MCNSTDPLRPNLPPGASRFILAIQRSIAIFRQCPLPKGKAASAGFAPLRQPGPPITIVASLYPLLVISPTVAILPQPHSTGTSGPGGEFSPFYTAGTAILQSRPSAVSYTYSELSCVHGFFPAMVAALMWRRDRKLDLRCGRVVHGPGFCSVAPVQSGGRGDR